MLTGNGYNAIRADLSYLLASLDAELKEAEGRSKIEIESAIADVEKVAKRLIHHQEGPNAATDPRDFPAVVATPEVEDEAEEPTADEAEAQTEKVDGEQGETEDAGDGTSGNAEPTSDTETGNDANAVNLEAMTVAELDDFAAKHEIPLPADALKADKIAAITAVLHAENPEAA